jgi:RNA polymerase sigma factor (sigma-70 family)
MAMVDPGDNPTTWHVRRACDGDRESLAWIVERFTPFLLAQAGYRLKSFPWRMAPEDVVAETWAVYLARCRDLPRVTPVHVKFLTTTLLHYVSNEKRKALRRTIGHSATAVEAAADATKGVVAKAACSEFAGKVAAALAEMDPHDQEVVVLCVIEGHTAREAASILGATQEAVKKRSQRARDRLRERLRGEGLDELFGD